MRKGFRNLVLGAVSLASLSIVSIDAQAMPMPDFGASAPAATSIEKVWCCRYYGWRRPYWGWRRPYGYGWGYRRWGWRRRWW